MKNGDAGDAQAVASWKKSFVRSSTGDEDATSTTVAASATAYDVDGPRRVARGDGEDARASDDAIERTAGVISRPPPRRRRRRFAQADQAATEAADARR